LAPCRFWDGGIAVEVSEDGKAWFEVAIEAQDCDDCNVNIAIIVDGIP
jgi:hypothetical protein